MYVNSQTLQGTRDITDFFSDDFYSSAIIYQLPDISSNEYAMTYLSREDLVAENYYGLATLFGLVLMSIGETVEKVGDKVEPIYEPTEKIELKNLSDIVKEQRVTVTANVLTSKDINTERRPNAKHYQINKSRKFTSLD